jgi:hypothetical protein
MEARLSERAGRHGSKNQGGGATSGGPTTDSSAQSGPVPRPRPEGGLDDRPIHTLTGNGNPAFDSLLHRYAMLEKM